MNGATRDLLHKVLMFLGSGNRIPAGGYFVRMFVPLGIGSGPDESDRSFTAHRKKHGEKS